jgi:putative oxidoreductase|tara:strand:+ start:996 stop:1391 length:396 start_codon:yes stop_codon:yes gene_type:complete
MEKFTVVIARVFLAMLFFISIIFIIKNIMSVPNGYNIYQDAMGSRGLPGIFAPISILVQFIFGLTLILGYKIKVSAYVLSIYSIFWAIIYFGNMNLLASLQYLAISGGLLHLGLHPNSFFSLDNMLSNKKK